MASNEGTTINECPNSESQVGDNEQIQQSCYDSLLDEPKPGMTFQSEEDAYNFYNDYARKKGFSIRKDRLNRRTDGTISSRKFVCSYAGIRAKHHGHETQNPHVNQRTECKCRIDLRVSRDGIWEIYNTFKDHNHLLVSPNKTFMLRSHRKILPSTLNIIAQMDKVGIPPSKAYDFLREGSGGSQSVGFMRIDHNNTLYCQKNKFNRNDAQSLLDHFKRKQLIDPAFFYAIQLSVDGCIENVLWADGKSLVDYSYFGDVMCFDSLGMLCMHAMKILTQNNIMSLPAKYILERWSKSAKVGLPSSVAQHEPSQNKAMQYTRVATNALALVKKCATSNAALKMLEQEFDSLSIKADVILSESEKGKIVPECESGVQINDEPCITIKPPQTKSIGPRTRHKSALERAVRKKTKQKNNTRISSSQTQVQSETMMNPFGFMGLLNQVSQEQHSVCEHSMYVSGLN